jgi:hypothetical protein
MFCDSAVALCEVEQLQLFVFWKHIKRLNALKQCELGGKRKQCSLAERRQRKYKNCTEEDHQLSIAVENLAQQELIFPAAD